jgi:hypothetical protein
MALTSLRRAYRKANTAFVTKTTVLGIFDSRAFLNLAMLMVESDLRSPTLFEMLPAKTLSTLRFRDI